ncbi:MAG: Crp/Fnr family transcriptional regulator, partial [Chloroflexota bacterium]|nr:Crp/Fnr family transcriptional regulator [Chloroflexota bacterium]
AELNNVAQAANTRKRENGSFYFFQEDPAKRIYVLLQGKVRLTQSTPEGQQIILDYVNLGESFGVVAFLSETYYPVSAQAVGNCQALVWDEAALNRLVERWPRIALNALRILANHTRDFQDKIRELSTERVERRIARAVLRLAQQTGRKIETGVLVDLAITRQDLAEMTGTTRYTVSRTLQQWEKQGLILAKREQIIIRYPHGLVSIAEDL